MAHGEHALSFHSAARPGPALMACLALACLWLTGCTPPAPTPTASQPPVPAAVAHDHDHDAKPAAADHHDHDEDHKHPETLAAAVAELATLCGSAKEALVAGDREKADGPVHAAGHLLEDMAGLITAAKLPAAAEGVATKAVEEIFSGFDKLDAAIHAAGTEAVEHAPHIEQIEAGLKSLLSLTSKKESGT
ncbi:MAG: hypothetical protein WCJ21_01920 [Planctomycetota bacterium]